MINDVEAEQVISAYKAGMPIDKISVLLNKDPTEIYKVLVDRHIKKEANGKNKR
jgi:hypothetical protein